ncbi:hypothetical protein EIN_306040 [Entamoeba invadens IP1]|uniref:Uncharacterized protein n=1 Tax=Entamoeba invadens IP1 TaxID=370355 RepID=A0A0A1U226_ENTIV|nr:hypothetical protein EIN_306040 [Entamoeba invadens IP1]ELP86708.1 hypothetical protein EIN_306040 [Entamoeba invadens IP1]|eukprot:XP_004186054.1 hypothetical protein EIN_306040 [Entamoeba invadens IP1]
MDRNLVKVSLWDASVGCSAIIYMYSATNHRTYVDMKEVIKENLENEIDGNSILVLAEMNSNDDSSRVVTDEEILEVKYLLNVDHYFKIDKITHQNAMFLVTETLAEILDSQQLENRKEIKHINTLENKSPNDNKNNTGICVAV